MRLIDADKIYDAVERRYQVSSGIEHRCERDLLELICLSETVDAAPVKHSMWKYYRKQNIAVCVNCRFERDLDVNFGKAVCCPNCGAKMDLKEEK